MSTIVTEESAIIVKTRELCDTIVAQTEFQILRRQIDQFMGDEEARAQYETLMEKGQLLQQKQQMGVPLESAEIDDFEKHREVLFNNPVAKGFLDAQEEMHRLQQSIGQYVARTFELGRTPSADDFSSCCSSHSCGCEH
ncbi:MAG: YlbF family regulator [Verrucomicrobia subdivision 3 bacterium]|nr:YlbF family regulator [Limisphaerales bacterium]